MTMTKADKNFQEFAIEKLKMANRGLLENSEVINQIIGYKEALKENGLDTAYQWKVYNTVVNVLLGTVEQKKEYGEILKELLKKEK